MKPRKKPRQLSTAIEETPEAGRANGGTLHGIARKAPLDLATLDAIASRVDLDLAKLDEIATVAGVPPPKLDLFKEEFLYAFDWALMMPTRRRPKRREVMSLLDGLIAALEPFLDDESASASVARNLMLPSLNLNEHTFRTRPVVKNLIERARIAKERAKLMRTKRGAPRGTRQGSELDRVLQFLLGRATDWGVKGTAYKDHSDGSAKGTLVQVMRLLQPRLVQPASDRTLLKAIDRVRKGSFPFRVHNIRARPSTKGRQKSTPNNQA
jgi:hypothetical protein